MSIQVGANDGQTIDINLQKIDSSTLGLSGFNVQASSTLKTTAITSSFADSGTAIGAVDVSGLGAGAEPRLVVSLLVLVLLLRPKLVRQLTLLLRLRLWWVRV